MSLLNYLRAAPKVELHLHLEGAVRPTTLLQLAQRNAVPLPYTTVEELRTWFRFRDFAHFGEVYGAISRCLRTADDYELIAYELAEELAAQHVDYAEVHFTPAYHTPSGYRSSRSALACSANRVFPTPPVPTSVSNRVRSSSC